MNENDKVEKKKLTVNPKLELKKIEKDQVRQSFSHGRSKTVEVEVKRKRVISADKGYNRSQSSSQKSSSALGTLTEGELENRLKAVQRAVEAQEKAKKEEKIEVLAPLPTPLSKTKEEISSPVLNEDLKDLTKTSLSSPDKKKPSVFSGEQVSLKTKTTHPRFNEGFTASDNISKRKSKTQEIENLKPVILRAEDYHKANLKKSKTGAPSSPVAPLIVKTPENSRKNFNKEKRESVREDVDKVSVGLRKEPVKGEPKGGGKAAPVKKVSESTTVPRKLTRQMLTKVLEKGEDLNSKTRSIASLRRARQKQKQQGQNSEENTKVIREVIIPETILVGELANRMAVRGTDVIKSLMRLGMMVTINQSIDADTAELICGEFGHTPKRVSEEDLEKGFLGQVDDEEDLTPRAPVVTVMGHVDHGKTSLLDALRKTDVAGGEAGGITQHIGAYQVTLQSGKKITFIDTPGHAAFTEMRARGANVTDIVVLVVAADDGIMAQTVEAIHHAQAAKVPIIVAINKIDKPSADPNRVRSELLNHGIIPEEFGGDIITVDVSAKENLNLDKLEESILLQAEILDLKANANRTAMGVVVEAKMEKGRGVISTVLIQKGTLNVGDVFVAGSQWGKVRALIDDHGRKIEKAFPSSPVEILGFDGIPASGDQFFIVDSEQKAREITDYRSHKEREKKNVVSARSSMEQMMEKISAGEMLELPLVIKADAHGSLEAIMASLAKAGTPEVSTKVLHGGVGGINESDVTLAKASNSLIIGFNVRANQQARDLAHRDKVDIRYYSVIYDVLDDIKGLLSGLLAPTLHEKFLGIAEIRNVFSISKTGKVAGCFVQEGLVKRNAKVRILRDNVVVHEGTLKSLRRFKDEVKEVKDNYECGIVLENYQDIREGDLIECFEIEKVARQL